MIFYMQLTKEQQNIVDFQLSGNSILKVIAFAGTGKTTTLIEYAERRPGTCFLYIAFNKSVQMDAASKFPGNVTCKTAHSLAWPGFGDKHKDRLVFGYKANLVKEVLNLNSYGDAKATIDTLTRYLASADAKVTSKHIPSAAVGFFSQKSAKMPDFVDLANKLGRLMCLGTDKRIGMLHDGYLKLYQLSNPVFNYNIIFLDEAQDVNPVITDIFIRQNSGRILVGDSHQQIYSFRGARDAMHRIKASRTLYLTHSFRFNSQIAQVANMILGTFKGETRKIIGLKEQKEKKGFKHYTIIARTNSAVFKEAAALHTGKKIGFVGGIKGYRFSRMTDAWYLQNRENTKIEDPFIKGFQSFNEMKEFAKAAEDWETMSICKVVEEYGGRIPNLVKQIRRASVEEHDAEIILSTAHKAKGLEWNNVHIASDFPDLVKNNKIISSQDLYQDEFNLIYVAVTRAMEGLRFNKDSSIMDFIIHKQKGS